MSVRTGRARTLVRCIDCGQPVSKNNAQVVENGYVGGTCLAKRIAQARSNPGR